jgi:hypothetical protein
MEEHSHLADHLPSGVHLSMIFMQSIPDMQIMHETNQSILNGVLYADYA